MGDLVNLRQIKKQNARSDKAKDAEANRARFGRSKQDKQRDELSAKRFNAKLDGHRMNDESEV